MSRQTTAIAATVLLLGLLVGYVLGAGAAPATGPVATDEAATARLPGESTRTVEGLPVVSLSGLPAEAVDTVGLIDAGGPFPFEQDGATFENRERLLPDRPSGYYREYTVSTPGSDDRGARRIVIGRDGEMYWTADHYDSFAWIAR